jgi:ATP-binding cassette subfamily B multidrug efflux pump
VPRPERRRAVEEMLRLVSLEGFEERRPGQLSGGQRQRVALARALLLEPRILILDDSLSSVDTQTEEHILGHLQDMAQGRTLILISHRISTVQDSDQIVVVEDGEIAERGRHAELIAAGGIYAAMYREQQVRESLEAE